MKNKINGSEQKYKSVKFKDLENVFLQYEKDESTNPNYSENEQKNPNTIVKIPIINYNSTSNRNLKEKLKKSLSK